MPCSTGLPFFGHSQRKHDVCIGELRCPHSTSGHVHSPCIVNKRVVHVNMRRTSTTATHTLNQKHTTTQFRYKYTATFFLKKTIFKRNTCQLGQTFGEGEWLDLELRWPRFFPKLCTQRRWRVMVVMANLAIAGMPHIVSRPSRICCTARRCHSRLNGHVLPFPSFINLYDTAPTTRSCVRRADAGRTVSKRDARGSLHEQKHIHERERVCEKPR